jgi:hypothetical protein
MAISAALGSAALLPAGLGFRNILINGDMRVAQRGTSVASITASNKPQACDRWTFLVNGLGTWTLSQDTDAPAGFAYSTKLLCTTQNASPAGPAYLQFEQRIEGLNIANLSYGTADARTLTLSFWVKSNVAGTFIARLFGPSSVRSIHRAFTIGSVNTWEYKTVTFPGDTTGSYPRTNAESLRFTFWLGAGTDFTSGTLNTSWAAYAVANTAVGCTNFAAATNNYISFTGLQLEQNYQPTPFEQRPYGTELQLCQRYYWRYVGQSGGYNRIPSTGGSYSGTSWQGVVAFPLTMRTTPSSIEASGIGCTDNVSFDSAVFSSVVLQAGNSHAGAAFVQCTGGSGITNGAGQILMLRGGATAYLGFSAEL